VTNPAALQEATRILAEELKLASRPQAYVIVDLIDRVVVIKGRGVELHRFSIEDWSAGQLADASTTFRLQTRPPVTRRKIEPAAAVNNHPSPWMTCQLILRCSFPRPSRSPFTPRRPTISGDGFDLKDVNGGYGSKSGP
jgi:hypothetical protein